MPDFHQPAADGELPDTSVEWQRGVTYTVRPDLLLPLTAAREYRLTFAIREMRAATGVPDYRRLYREARALADGRIEELRAGRNGARLHHWVASRGWRSTPMGDAQSCAAFLVIGFCVPADGQALPTADSEPGDEDLRSPGGATPEQLQDLAPQRSDEIYTVFDNAADRTPASDILLFSYGESLRTGQVSDYEPYVRRAGARARFYCRHSRGRDDAPGEFQIVRRQWWCVTNPSLVTVHVYFRLG